MKKQTFLFYFFGVFAILFLTTSVTALIKGSIADSCWFLLLAGLDGFACWIIRSKE